MPDIDEKHTLFLENSVLNHWPRRQGRRHCHRGPTQKVLEALCAGKTLQLGWNAGSGYTGEPLSNATGQIDDQHIMTRCMARVFTSLRVPCEVYKPDIIDKPDTIYKKPGYDLQ